MVEGPAFFTAAAVVDDSAAHCVCAVDWADVVGLVQRHVRGDGSQLLGHRDLRTAPTSLPHRMGEFGCDVVHRVVEPVRRHLANVGLTIILPPQMSLGRWPAKRMSSNARYDHCRWAGQSRFG